MIPCAADPSRRFVILSLRDVQRRGNPAMTVGKEDDGFGRRADFTGKSERFPQLTGCVWIAADLRPPQ